MARSDIVSIIPLDSFATIVGLDPLHFNSVVSEIRPERNACDDMWFQYNWQGTGRVSRDEIAVCLKTAEQRVADRLGYYPVPVWITDEEHELRQPYPPELSWVNPVNVRGRRQQSIRTKYGYFIEGGRRTKTLIESRAGILYTDTDGDGYYETATVTSTTTVTDAEEIHIYFPGENGHDSWEIRPANVLIAGGTAYITFRREQAVLPDLWAQIPTEGNPMAVDGDDDDNFLSALDVYRVYNDPSEQLYFYPEYSCEYCGSSGCEVCVDSAESGCMTIRDRRNGIVRFARADWDETEEKFDYASFSTEVVPERMRIWYRAGRIFDAEQDYPHFRMDRTWERAICFYALSLLDMELCGCDNFKRVFSHQTTDLAQNTQGRSFNVSFEMLNCPLGTTRAAINLWNMISAPGNRLGSAR